MKSQYPIKSANLLCANGAIFILLSKIAKITAKQKQRHSFFS